MILPARSHFVAVAFLGLLAPPTRADDGVELRWKFAPKQMSRYATSVEIKAQQKKQGSEALEFVSKRSNDINWVVDSVDDDKKAHITQTIERVRVEVSGPEEKVAFDSNESQLPEGLDERRVEPLRMMVNEQISLTIDPHGKVIDVRPSGKLAAKIKQAPQGPAAAIFSPENLKQEASSNSVEFPAKPLSRGTTWQHQSTVSEPALGRQTLVITYRYDGSEEHDGQMLDKISATAKVTPVGNAAAPQPVTIKDQKSNGVIWFDRAVGRIHEMDMTTKVVRDVTFGANKFEETVTTKMHMQLVGESDPGR